MLRQRRVFRENLVDRHGEGDLTPFHPAGVPRFQSRGHPHVGRDPALEKYFAVSFEGWERFAPPIPVTHVAADPRTEKNCHAELPGSGHHKGLAARVEGAFQMMWSAAEFSSSALR